MFEYHRLPRLANFEAEFTPRGKVAADQVVAPEARVLRVGLPEEGELTASALPLGSSPMKVMLGARPMLSSVASRMSNGLWPE